MPDSPEMSLQVTPPNETQPRAIPELNIGISLASADRTIVHADPVFGDFLGYRPDEVAGKSIDEITHPDDLALTSQAFDCLLSPRCRTHTYDKRYLRKDGTVFWSHTTLSRVEGEGGTDSPTVIEFIDDITHHKETEEALQATNSSTRIWENLGGALSLIDRDHRDCRWSTRR